MVSHLTCSYRHSPVFNISSQVRSKGDSDTSCCLASALVRGPAPSRERSRSRSLASKHLPAFASAISHACRTRTVPHGAEDQTPQLTDMRQIVKEGLLTRCLRALTSIALDRECIIVAIY